MNINPRYAGGEIIHQTITEKSTLDIRKPFFDVLFDEWQRGFVLIDRKGNIPDIITDTIDYDSDNLPDLIIKINKSNPETEISFSNPKVKGVEISTQTSYGWAVRVKIKN